MPAAEMQKRTAAEATQQREQDAALAAQQREDLRQAAIDALVRLGPGLVAYGEKRWAWDPSNDAFGIETAAWKRLPRLLYLFAQVMVTARQLDWLAIRPGAPYWCGACHGEDEVRPANYYVGECPEHSSAGAVAINLGMTLFGDNDA